MLALGKDGNAYLLNRNNLGGITAPVAQANWRWHYQGPVIRCTYNTSQGTYFVFSSRRQLVKAYKITADESAYYSQRWSVSQNGQGSPWVTTTDGTNNAIVWVVGAQGDHVTWLQWRHRRCDLRGGTDELMTGTRKWNSGIAARGSIYVAQ